jgi:anthranilate phosphoribosyltransferase
MNGGALSRVEARQAMNAILSGSATTPQIAAFLAAIRVKQESVDEVLGFTEALRENAICVDHGLGAQPLLDTCGTGGDARGTINVSTLAAIVIASCGVAVAKHGNRSISSRCGSADLLEALGISILTDPALVASSIREIGIGFLFAPALHPAMKNAMPARKELGIRTVFNVLGPLVNPAHANRQLVGAPSLKGAEIMSQVLSRLGLEHGLVVHGADGVDEISLTGPTHVFQVTPGDVSHHTLNPQDFGFVPVPMECLLGDDIETNARIARDILAGKPGPMRDFVVLNAAAGLRIAGAVDSWLEGRELAESAITRGASAALVDKWSAWTRARANQGLA